MTDLLTELMHDKADSLGPPDLDVLEMVREGNRRVGRRRNAVIGATVAAVVVAAFAVPTMLVNGRDTARDVAPASAFATPQPAFATGSIVHVGTEQFDVGQPVQSLFVTTEGIVFAIDDGTVFATDGTGQPEEIGTADLGRGSLIGNGSRAVWIDPQPGGAPVFTVFDRATGETMEADYDTAGEGATEYHPTLFAIDGDDVYFRDARGVIRWNVESGDLTGLGRPEGAEIFDVKSGVIAHSLPHNTDYEVFAATEFGAGAPPRRHGGPRAQPVGERCCWDRWTTAVPWSRTRVTARSRRCRRPATASSCPTPGWTRTALPLTP
ncbi:hypothetical protein [Nocardioides sp. B-3]|uniref:hypothetical protein n=1 Tax=Nocardioides sp. B-3 TaxID=2895565 RepID=UPI002152F921|nr:hypothetical protein [Nocardioides sp. B-3]UUZ58942.1 hypothetical protein LP418_23320 [Nocardioides sp. B-3]